MWSDESMLLFRLHSSKCHISRQTRSSERHMTLMQQLSLHLQRHKSGVDINVCSNFKSFRTCTYLKNLCKSRNQLTNKNHQQFFFSKLTKRKALKHQPWSSSSSTFKQNHQRFLYASQGSCWLQVTSYGCCWGPWSAPHWCDGTWRSGPSAV